MDESGEGGGGRGRSRSREGLAGRDARRADGRRSRQPKRPRDEGRGRGRAEPKKPRSRRTEKPRDRRRSRAEEPEPQGAERAEGEARGRPSAAAGVRQRAGQVLRRSSAGSRANTTSTSSKVRGTGAGGRVTRDDVLAYVERAASAGAGGRPADGKAAAAPRSAAQLRAPPPAGARGAGERTRCGPLTHIRKRIAEHMSARSTTSARAWNAIEVDMEEIAKLRAKVGEDFKQREGFSLTYLPFIARAVCDALLANPVVNASLSEDLTEATYHNYVNLGIAVATDYGLIVPVIKGAEALNVVGLARAVRDLAERARDKKLAAGRRRRLDVHDHEPRTVRLVPVRCRSSTSRTSRSCRPKQVEKRVVVGRRHDRRSGTGRSCRCRGTTACSTARDAMQFLQRLKENLETWDFSREVSRRPASRRRSVLRRGARAADDAPRAARRRVRSTTRCCSSSTRTCTRSDAAATRDDVLSTRTRCARAVSTSSKPTAADRSPTTAPDSSSATRSSTSAREPTS